MDSVPAEGDAMLREEDREPVVLGRSYIVLMLWDHLGNVQVL